MNKKGFTIIELLGIIIIIGVIGIVSFNSIVGTIERNQVRQENAFTEQVINAASLYVTANLSDFEELEYSSNNVYIDVTTLIEKGYIKKEIDNPTSTETEDYLIEVYKTSEGVLDYRLVTEKTLVYKDPILNGADPEFEEDFIPVTIENDGTVKKADVSSEWYNYEDKLWANMVMVSNATKDNYINAASETIIQQSDILSYFVWIPRYKYKISTSKLTKDPKDYNPSTPSVPTTIDIVFENKSTSKSKGDAINTYFSHPAFTFGDEELNGVWIGKFEMSLHGSNDLPKIIPNAESKTFIELPEAYVYSKMIGSDFENGNNELYLDLMEDYVIDSKFDSHILKGADWGAAAYLSHSVYGINKEVRINNNIDEISGCGASSDSALTGTTCEIPYGSTTNYPSSTTGNITGLFDMSGGTYESTMGYIKVDEDKISTFTSDPNFFNNVEDKYYTVYNTLKHDNKYTLLCNDEICRGHALNETQSWYTDYSTINGLIINRGGYNGSSNSSGVFSYNSSTYKSTSIGYRPAITMTETKNS